MDSKLMDKSKNKERFFYSVKKEMLKVVWPPKDKLFLCTKIVLSSVIFFGVGVYLVDICMKNALDLFSLIGAR